MKNKNLIKLLVSLVSVSVLSACGGSTPTPTPEVDYDKFIPGYTYMWHYDGRRQKKNRIAMQSDKYAMFFDYAKASIIGLNVYNEKDYREYDFSKLNAVENTVFSVKSGGTYHNNLENKIIGRHIMSGRHLNRWDNNNLCFDGLGSSIFGRVEYVGTRNYVCMTYQAISETALTTDLKFSFDLPKYNLIIEDNIILATDADENGFAILAQENDIELSFENKTVTLERTGVDLIKNTFRGLGAVIIPVINGDTSLVSSFLENQNVDISATNSTSGSLDIEYDPTDGVYYVDCNKIPSASQNAVTGRTNYAPVEFEIDNDSTMGCSPLICFRRTDASNITGGTGVIRDKTGGTPTGEQTQTSKNWHTFSDQDTSLASVTKKLYQGYWENDYACFDIKANEKIEREYLCINGQWGEAYTASHAQLCLVGWGGNDVWDESALGCWGESVTYDPEIGQNRSMIDDVRCFLVTASTGGNQRWNWTGNVGGANFLDYYVNSEHRYIVDQKIGYKTQGPNITDVFYTGVTDDNKIKSYININLGRTNDINRNYYTMRYEFLEDVDASRLSFFKVAADGYSDNWFTKYAYGTSVDTIEKDLPVSNIKAGYQNGDRKDVTGKNFWFGLYNSTGTEENADVMMCVRGCKATLNGKEYSLPGYELYGTSNGNVQPSCEITTPVEVGNKVKKGSVIELNIEYSILPNNSDTFYGEADYLVQTKTMFGSATAFYQQAVGGEQIAKASVGEITKSYPLTIKAKQENIAAEFELSGGLGYVPVFFDNLKTNDYKLQVKNGTEWEDIDQSVKGNDFWQVNYDEYEDVYQYGFNVVNTVGIDFNLSNSYRLIKK